MKRYQIFTLTLILLIFGLNFPLYANTVQPSGGGGSSGPPTVSSSLQQPVMFVGAGTYSVISAATTTGTINSPTGVANGDQELVFIGLNNATSSAFVPPAGWTAIPSCNAQGNTETVQVFSHTAASEGGTIAAFTWTTAGSGKAWAVAYRNAAIDVCAASTAATATTFNTPTITAAATTDRVLAFAFAANYPVNTNATTGMTFDVWTALASSTAGTVVSYPITSTSVPAFNFTAPVGTTVWAGALIGLSFSASSTAGAPGALTYNQLGGAWLNSLTLGTGQTQTVGLAGIPYSLAIPNTPNTVTGGIGSYDDKGVPRTLINMDSVTGGFTQTNIGDAGADSASISFRNNATFNGNMAIGSDNAVNTMARMSFPSFVDATAATTTIPYGCSLTTKAVTFENVQFTVTSVTQSVAPSLSLCDTGTTANPVACGTTIVNSGTFTAAGNISQTSMTNANVAAGHFVCTFFAAGTATVVIAQATGTARPQ